MIVKLCEHPRVKKKTFAKCPDCKAIVYYNPDAIKALR